MAEDLIVIATLTISVHLDLLGPLVNQALMACQVSRDWTESQANEPMISIMSHLKDVSTAQLALKALLGPLEDLELEECVDPKAHQDFPEEMEIQAPRESKDQRATRARMVSQEPQAKKELMRRSQLAEKEIAVQWVHGEKKGPSAIRARMELLENRVRQECQEAPDSKAHLVLMVMKEARDQLEVQAKMRNTAHAHQETARKVREALEVMGQTTIIAVVEVAANLMAIVDVFAFNKRRVFS